MRPAGTSVSFQACLDQVDIDPTDETAFKVPDGFTVADKDKFVRGLVRGIAGASAKRAGAF